jgi:hypothetical protein
VYDAYMATFAAQVSGRNAETEMNRTRLQSEYDAGLVKLGDSQVGDRRNLETSLLARGVGRSGEAIRRHGDLETDYATRRTDAARALADGYASLDQGLAGYLAELAAQREGAIAESRLRLLGQGKAVPGSDTPGAGASPGYKPVKPKKAKSTGSKVPAGAYDDWATGVLNPSTPYAPNQPTGAPTYTPVRRTTPPGTTRRRPSTGGGAFYS